jgi:hypothetical protein
MAVKCRERHHRPEGSRGYPAHLEFRAARTPPPTRHWPAVLPTPWPVRLRSAPRTHLVVWEARQLGDREGVSERPCVAFACVDALHRARLPADLANNSPPPDNGLTWRSGRLF